MRNTKRILALMLAFLLLAGCGTQTQAPGEDTPLTEAEAGEETKTVSLAIDTARSLDPYETTSACNRLLLELTTQPLFTVGADGTVTAVLAEGYAVSPDGLTTTVSLKKNILFHDGTALTAERVKNSVEKALQGSYYKGRFYALESVAVQDDDTVVFTTDTAYECFPQLLDIPITAEGEDGFVGTGPYVFGETSLIPWEKWQSETYPAGKKPISLTPVENAAQLQDAFRFGGILAVASDPNAVGAVEFGGNHALWGVPTTALQYIGFNLESGIFHNASLRQSVLHAVDRDAIVSEDMAGFGAAAALPTRPGSVWWDGALARDYGYDPQKVLFSAGLAATMIVSGEGSQKQASARRVAAELEKAGLSVTVKVLSAKEFRRALQNGDFDLCYAEARLSPNLDLMPFFQKGGAFAYGGLDNLSQLRELCRLTLGNHGNAYDLYTTILENAYLCPVAFKNTALSLRNDAFAEVQPHLGGWFWQ